MESPTPELDEDRPCNVCFSKLAEHGNEMVFCDGCDVCVHQACYGIQKIPDGDWFCDRCAAKAKDEPCVLCPVYEGAMKRTEQGNWCHCSCVWWIPGLHFQDPIEMRLVMGVPNVDKARYKLKCIFCDTKNGACIECSHKNCRNSFHVTCAFATKEFPDGATFLMYEETDCVLIKKAFCPKHRDQQAIERAKVKKQITSNNMEGPQRKVSGKVSAPKDVAEGKHIRTSIETPVTRTPSSTSRATPKKHSPLTKSRSKTPTVTPTPSLGSKYSRRETPSTYYSPSVNAEDGNGQNSPKRARKSNNNEATAEELRVLKEYSSLRHASVDTQDHPCTSLLPPLMRWTRESHTTSLFHGSTSRVGSIFSSMEGSFD